MKNFLVSLILHYLRFFARVTLKQNRPTVIGITGSAGKSSARTILATILKPHFKTKEVYGNSETGIPLGILGIKPDSLGFETPLRSILDWLRILLQAPFAVNNLRGTEYLIIEMGIDDPYPPKNMEYLLTIVKPDIAIFLNAGPAHTMQFEKILTKEQTFRSEAEKVEYLTHRIAEEKAKIITRSGCKVGIYSADNEYVVQALMKEKSALPGKFYAFGKGKDNELVLTSYKVTEHGTTFGFLLKNQEKKHKEFTISVKNYVLAPVNQATIAAAVLAAIQSGLSVEQITKELETHFTLPPGRASLFKGIHKSLIIDSSYNASRIAVESMLDLVSELKKQTKRPTVLLFGDMRELGNESQHEHELVTQKMFGVVDYLFLVGPQTREFVLPVVQTNEDAFKAIRWFQDSKRAGDHLKENLPHNAIVLVKGSQNTLFLEEAIKMILADKSDEHLLCRQEDYWLKKKIFFNT